MNLTILNTDGHMMEQMVADLLRRSGFIIIDQNYKVGHLEIDLIAMERETLCFIEVKSRAKPIRLEEVDEIISAKQREHITTVADIFCRNTNRLQYKKVRFDYALVYVPQNEPPRVQYIRDAFTPTHPDLQ